MHMLSLSLPISNYCVKFHELIGTRSITTSLELIYEYITKNCPIIPLDHYSQQIYCSKSVLLLSYNSPDFQTLEHTEIPILFSNHSNNEKSDPNSKNLQKITFSHLIFHDLIQNMQINFHLTIAESCKMLELYLLTCRFILACYQHEKIGRDFVQSGYILELLGKYLVNLSDSQKHRFYYWELLKFDINNFIVNWYTFDSFELLLTKFID